MQKCKACKKKFDPEKLQEPWQSSGICGKCAFEYIDDEATSAEDWLTRDDVLVGLEDWLERRQLGEE